MKADLTSPFNIEGELVDFVKNKRGIIKGIKVLRGEQSFVLKLAKELKKFVKSQLTKGDLIHIFGVQTTKYKTQAIKFKAYQIQQITCSLHKITEGKILLCHKSGCAKRGGKKLYKAISSGLEQLGLKNHVQLETTGCQKRCGKAPNLVMMPGKARYSNIYPGNIAELLEKHYLS